MSQARLAIVAPAFNEQEAISVWISSVDSFAQRVMGAVVHLVIVDDGSSDGTYQRCMDAKKSLKMVKLHPLRLVRNFGHQAALMSGLQFTAKHLAQEVDCVVTMDCDGEHPLEVIPQLIEAWRLGDALVHTKRREHQNLSIKKVWLSKIFYKTIQVFAGLPIEEGMADFKLWDKQLLVSVQDDLPQSGALRLFAVYLAPRSQRIEFDQRVIAGRVSRFSGRKMLSLAVQSLVSYSAFPMRLIGILAGLSLVFSLVVMGQSLWAYWSGHVVPGWTSLMVALAFFSGLNTFCLFLVAEYLLRFSFRSKLPPYVRRDEAGNV